MALNPNVWRVSSANDIATNNAPYSQQKASGDRISVVRDPLGQRGQVVKLFRNTGDALVNLGRRCEIARDVFQSEYAFNTGGGWYWTSYMLGGEWAAAVESGALDHNEDTSAIISQFHPRNLDGFAHPIYAIQVNQFGVRLVKNSLDDSATHRVLAAWPLDQWAWHDIVWGIVWNGYTDGKFYFFLDGNLLVREHGPQIYYGASAGGWYSEGIYLPGAERAVDSLSIYTQGYKQGYPGTAFSVVYGSAPTNIIRKSENRLSASAPRQTATRPVAARSKFSSSVDIVI